MDNLNFDWLLGFGMKSLGGGNHRLGSISQVWRFGDLSDIFRASNNLKLLQIYSAYHILNPVGTSMSNPN